MPDVWSLLQQRRRTAPGSPVVTFVDAGRGERVELSAVSLENAAAKIANALTDEFGLGPGATVGLHLPVHWQRSAWCAGIWIAGCIAAPGAVDASLVVAGPQEAAGLVGAGAEVAVVSLHPFGLALDEPLPDGAVDVTLAVRQQPDAFLGVPADGRSPALLHGDDVLDQDGTLAAARALGERWGLDDGGRLLVDAQLPPEDAWLATLAVPLACSASVVLVLGDPADATAQERITARAT